MSVGLILIWFLPSPESILLTLNQMKVQFSISRTQFISKSLIFLGFAFFIFIGYQAQAQSLYSARGYWDELNKTSYQVVKQKQLKGDSLTSDENTYLADFEKYLGVYLQRLSESERKLFDEMKDRWDQEKAAFKKETTVSVSENPFQLRNRDRLNSAGFGVYYGLAFSYGLGLGTSATTGVSILSGGAMLLGPAINPKRFDQMTQASVEALSGGRFMGLGLGAALGLGIIGIKENGAKIILPLSALASIGLGEAALWKQKTRKWTSGEIRLMNHYGFLLPFSTASFMAAIEVNEAESYGFGLFGSGVAGLLIGKQIGKLYPFTGGDVDAISSLSWISAGIGLTFAAATIESTNNNQFSILVPATTSIAGTLIGQRLVKGAKLTDRQGNVLILASSGAALMGLGISILAEFDSPTPVFAISSFLPLLTHQILFHKFAKKNKVAVSENRKPNGKTDFYWSFNPESYFINKGLKNGFGAAPMVKLKLRF